MDGLVKSLATGYRIAVPYFRSEDHRKGRLLLIAVVAIQLCVVATTILFNRWYNGFYGALQDRNWDAFLLQIGYFFAIAISGTFLNVYLLYLSQWLEIRWRSWMTQFYVDHWLSGAKHYRMQLMGDPADNPDQRIAEDIKLFIERTLTIGVGFVGALTSIASFVVILWGLSEQAPIHLSNGTVLHIPGYLVWAALIYATIGSLCTHLIGRQLTPLNFTQQRYEADFRFNLVRVRENSEQIALLGGEAVETDRLRSRFASVAANWYRIMSRQKRLSFFTAGYNQVAIIFPILIVSPAYFAGVIQLGSLVQTSGAFAIVQVAMSFFVTTYREFAEWRAVIARLDGFNRSMAAAQDAATTPTRVSVLGHSTMDEISVAGLSVHLPAGTPVVAAENLVIKAGQSVLITGPSGSGKSTFFRALAGVWPFGTGTITVPRGAKMMVLPQKPYFAVGSLEDAVSYPSDRGTFTLEQIADVLKLVGLPALASRLTEEAHWTQILSLGEQQRLSVARAILHAPDFLFLDEATASLDEDGEAKLYALLQKLFPAMTIVSIGHRSTLVGFHNKRFTLHPEGELHHIRASAADNQKG